MALQTSGAISLSQVQGEFGGSNPISMSEYYRNGSYVPSTITTTSTTGWYGQFSPLWTWIVPAGTSTYQAYWNGTNVGSGSGSSITVSGYTYDVGSLWNTISDKTGTTYYYQIRRTGSTSTTVNSSIPTSGTISMSQFYGGRKT